MEDFIWRTWARVVAYVELVLSILSSMAVLLITVAAGIVSTVAATNAKIQVFNDWFGAEYPAMAIVCWMWLVVLAFILVTGIQLWASLKLLSATEFGMDIYEALEKARFWRNTTFAFLVFEVVGVAAAIFVVGVTGWGPHGYIMILGIGYLLWRGGFMFLLFQYMNELETALDAVGVGGAEAGYIYPDRVFVK